MDIQTDAHLRLLLAERAYASGPPLFSYTLPASLINGCNCTNSSDVLPLLGSSDFLVDAALSSAQAHSPGNSNELSSLLKMMWLEVIAII